MEKNFIAFADVSLGAVPHTKRQCVIGRFEDAGWTWNERGHDVVRVERQLDSGEEAGPDTVRMQIASLVAPHFVDLLHFAAAGSSQSHSPFGVRADRI